MEFQPEVFGGILLLVNIYSTCRHTPWTDHDREHNGSALRIGTGLIWGNDTTSSQTLLWGMMKKQKSWTFLHLCELIRPLSTVFFCDLATIFFSFVGHKYHHQHYHNDHHLLGIWSGRSCLSTSSGESVVPLIRWDFRLDSPSSRLGTAQWWVQFPVFFSYFWRPELGVLDVTCRCVTGCWDAWHASGADRGCWDAKEDCCFVVPKRGKEFRFRSQSSAAFPSVVKNWTWNYFSIQNESSALQSGPLQLWLPLSI